MEKNHLKKINFSTISELEKKELKDKINHSIYSYILRKRKLKYSLGIAASIVLLISFGIFNTIISNNSITPIESFVKTLDNESPNTVDNIKLVLAENESVDIKGTNPEITYKKSGKEVKINGSQSINQKLLEDNGLTFNTLIVPYGKRSDITLTDGTKVWLNSGSKLVFPASFIGEIREVYIEGEAIFEVSHDKDRPFIVKTGMHDIEVLGTVFNVSNYSDDDDISTVLKSGIIQISYKTTSFLKANDGIKITPGTIAVFNKNHKNIGTREVDVEKYFSWRDGIFIFKNDSLNSIMKKISRYYNVVITIENETLANETFSGYLDVKDNVENVIRTINETTPLQYKIENTNIIIN